MVIIEHGIVSNGGIALEKPLPLPDGSPIVVRVESEPAAASDPDAALAATEFAALPFFGQWADRQDIVDSSEYVRQERAKWQQRPYRQG